MTGDFSKFFLSHRGKLVDKWSSYLPIYDRILEEYKSSPINLLEIGIQNGGSLEVWSQYFPYAKTIVGCDIAEPCKELVFGDPRIKFIAGDANSDNVFERISSVTREYDIIIDDGSHNSKDIISSFIHYFPILANDGIYIVEDLHASYWSYYAGGLAKPESAIEFFKKLIDVNNFEHWGMAKSKLDYLEGFFQTPLSPKFGSALDQIHEISFVNSICEIRKKARETNRLGVRRVVGEEEPATPGFKHLDGKENTPQQQFEEKSLLQRLGNLLKK